jgi:hypothetical protein
MWPSSAAGRLGEVGLFHRERFGKRGLTGGRGRDGFSLLGRSRSRANGPVTARQTGREIMKLGARILTAAVCLLPLPAWSGGSLSREQLAAERDAAFVQADADQDGAFTLEEFKAFRAIMEERMLERHFEAIDTNDDNLVSADELAAFRPPRRPHGPPPLTRP